MASAFFGLHMPLSFVDGESIVADLGQRYVPSEVRCYDTVSSTMDVVREQTLQGASEGLLVLAEAQTAGRGRLGRPWASPPGSNLYLSLLLRPTWLKPVQAFRLTMAVAVSLCEAIEATTPLVARLKWPNDLLVERAPGDQSLAKAAGILVELSLRGNSLAWAIVGCGINVNSHPPADAGLRYPATSLSASVDHPVDRLVVLRNFLRSLDVIYAELVADHHEALFASWRERLVTIGSDVRVETPAGLLVGRAEDVEPSGALLVRTSNGALHTVTTGDVQA